MIAAAEIRRQHAADQRHRQGQERQHRQPPAPERGLQEQEDRRAPATIAEEQQAALRRLALRVLAQQLGVVPERERRPSSSCSSTSRDHRRRDRGPSHVGADVDAARELLVLDRRSASARSRTSATSSSRTWPPSACRSAGSRIVGQAVARLGRAPHVHVVGLAVAEDVADLLAGHQRRRGPPDVAGLEAVAAAPRPGRPRPRSAGRRPASSTCAVDDAGDARERARCTSSRLGAAGRRRSWPKMRTTIASLDPVSTSSIRSLR